MEGRAADLNLASKERRAEILAQIEQDVANEIRKRARRAGWTVFLR